MNVKLSLTCLKIFKYMLAIKAKRAILALYTRMIDWQIKPLSKKSALSGKPLKAGDVVVCAVFSGQNGELERADILQDEFENAKFDKPLLGKWSRKVSENPDEDEKFAKKLALASSEDFFISLFDEGTEQSSEKDILKMLLALLLERKRILRAQGRPIRNVQKYLHIQSKRVFDVPQPSIDAELIVKIQSQIDSIII